MYGKSVEYRRTIEGNSVNKKRPCHRCARLELPLPVTSQAAQTLFVIYIRDSIALYFEPFKRMQRMYENGSKIALNSAFSKGFK